MSGPARVSAWAGAIRAWGRLHPLRLQLGGLVVVALAARVGYVLGTGSFAPIHDALDYYARGVYIFEHHRLINEPGTGVPGRPALPDAYWPPFYMIFLAFCDGLTRVFLFLGISTVEMPRLVQALLGSAGVGLLGLIALRLFGRRAALATAAIAAVFPAMIEVGASLDSESLLVPLMIGAVAAVVEYRHRPRRWLPVAAGALTGLAWLTHSDGAILVVPLAVGLWPRGGLRLRAPRRVAWRAFAPLVSLLAVCALVISPWTVRNAVKFHAFVPISLSLGNTLAGTYNSATQHRKVNRGVWIIPWNLPYYYAVFHTPGESEVTQNSRATALAIRFIEHNPGYVAQVWLWNTERLLDVAGFRRSDQTAYWQGISAGANHVAVYAFWVIGLLALAGAFTTPVRRGQRWIWLAPLLLYLGVVFLQSDTPRFRAPVDPYLTILAGVAASQGWPRLAALARRRRPGGHAEYANT